MSAGSAVGGIARNAVDVVPPIASECGGVEEEASGTFPVEDPECVGALVVIRAVVRIRVQMERVA